MADHVWLVKFSIAVLITYVLLFLALRREHGIPLRQQFQALGHLLGAFKVAVASRIVPARRQERRLVERHEWLCVAVRATTRVLQETTVLFQSDDIPKGTLEDATDAHDDAVCDLREFLGRLTDEDVAALTRGINRMKFFSRLDEAALREFFVWERESADDASAYDLIGHFGRYAGSVARQLPITCQPDGNPV